MAGIVGDIFRNAGHVAAAGGQYRRVVDRVDVEGEGVGGGVKVTATVGDAAIVLYLEGHGGIAGAVNVGCRGKDQLAGVYVCTGYAVTGTNGSAVQGKGACRGQ